MVVRGGRGEREGRGGGGGGGDGGGEAPVASRGGFFHVSSYVL